MSSAKAAMSGSSTSKGSAAKAAMSEVELLRASVADLEAGNGSGVVVATAESSVRLGFLRKVFGILAVQLAATTLLCGAFMTVSGLRALALAAPGLLSIVCGLGAIGVLFSIAAYKDSYPLNMYMLGLFTFLESITVGVVCAAYAEAGLGYLVLEALVLTMAIFVGISAYCFISKKDFSFMGAGLMAGLFALLGASFVNLILGFTGGKSAGLALLISWGGATLFALCTALLKALFFEVFFV